MYLHFTLYFYPPARKHQGHCKFSATRNVPVFSKHRVFSWHPGFRHGPAISKHATNSWCLLLTSLSERWDVSGQAPSTSYQPLVTTQVSYQYQQENDYTTYLALISEQSENEYDEDLCYAVMASTQDQVWVPFWNFKMRMKDVTVLHRGKSPFRKQIWILCNK